jgi:hypothetical protein
VTIRPEQQYKALQIVREREKILTISRSMTAVQALKERSHKAIALMDCVVQQYQIW